MDGSFSGDTLLATLCKESRFGFLEKLLSSLTVKDARQMEITDFLKKCSTPEERDLMLDFLMNGPLSMLFSKDETDCLHFSPASGLLDAQGCLLSTAFGNQSHTLLPIGELADLVHGEDAWKDISLFDMSCNNLTDGDHSHITASVNAALQKVASGGLTVNLSFNHIRETQWLLPILDHPNIRFVDLSSNPCCSITGRANMKALTRRYPQKIVLVLKQWISSNGWWSLVEEDVREQVLETHNNYFNMMEDVANTPVESRILSKLPYVRRPRHSPIDDFPKSTEGISAPLLVMVCVVVIAALLGKK